ncbi:membrane protein YbiO [Atlantibacter hermannii]|nr:membrane protein YbiO [Atlantibacter hermannii]
MENDDIRPLVIGQPSFVGIVGLTNTSFTIRVTFTTPAVKTVDGALRARQHGEETF